jgi:L-ascorbate metabolism protein UlaG (beta-lactamase superfamily)
MPENPWYTMNYKEAASATNTIKPKIVIPIHYGSVVGKKSDGEDFKRLVDKDIECLLLI